MKLESGQVAVVTGGTSGIGLALAEAFAARGLRVVIADVRADSLAPAEATLRDLGAEVVTSRTDVRDPAAVEALADLTVDRFGRVDVVCNNAGVSGPLAPMWEQEIQTWRWVLDVALMGVIHGIRSFVPRLLAAGSGHIVNTASIGGLMPLPMLAPYNAAKHAVVGLTETLARELRATGTEVRASVLCPGRVDTPLEQTSRAAWAADPSAGAPPAPTAAQAPAANLILTAAQVAELTLAGIETDRLHIITHADSAIPVRSRVRRLLDDLPEAAPAPA